MIKDIVYNEDCLTGLKKLPDGCIDCCVTSPPYYGLRDYGHSEQLGLEETPELYVEKMVQVFEQVRRVLKKEGTLWLNLGDSYCSTAPGTYCAGSKNYDSKEGIIAKGRIRPQTPIRMKPKDLIGIPWMVAFALRSAGWYLRQDIIWHKPNPMPESVTDRCTKSHEYIFLLSKSAKYYYDAEAINTPIAKESIARMAQDIKNQKGSSRVPGKTNGEMKAVIKGLTFGGKKGREYKPDENDPNFRNGSEQWGRQYEPSLTANKKSVWTVTTMPYSEAHFATFPERLIVDCMKAGCPEGGIVLDPFAGAFTTPLVAKKLGRHYIGYELNSEYIKIGKNRMNKELGMFQ